MVCFHLAPDLIRDIVDGFTPNIEDNSYELFSEFLIKKTSSSVSLDLPAFSPYACLILSRISLLLSALSPLKRCSGFIHNGVSHLWHTTSSSDRVPQKHLYDSLCAYTFLPSFHITGYPRLEAPLNIQHPFAFLSILSIKRILMSGPFGLAMAVFSLDDAIEYNVNSKDGQVAA